jgi:hypothetical protein
VMMPTARFTCRECPPKSPFVSIYSTPTQSFTADSTPSLSFLPKMLLKSLYPDLPELPEANAYHTLFKRPDQVQWPDFTLHIDVKTGHRRKYSEFLKRIEDLATSLATPASRGGLELKGEGEILGILSENCMVRKFLPGQGP